MAGTVPRPSLLLLMALLAGGSCRSFRSGSRSKWVSAFGVSRHVGCLRRQEFVGRTCLASTGRVATSGIEGGQGTAPAQGGVEEGDYFLSSSSNAAASAGGSAASGFGPPSSSTKRVTLTRYLNSVVQEKPELRDMEALLLAVQMACKTISNLVNRAGIHQLSTTAGGGPELGTGNPPYDVRLNSMKKLDQLSTSVLRNALRFTGKLQTITEAKEPGLRDNDDGEDPDDDYQPGVLIASALDSRYVAIFDPLDGSGNADAAICTGTIFGVFETPTSLDNPRDTSFPHDAVDTNEAAHAGGVDNVVVGGADGGASSPPTPLLDVGDRILTEDELLRSVLQPGSKLCGAGYCLYSSATILVFTLGDDDKQVHGFTLDPRLNEFVQTHSDLRIPRRGNVYSCNEANSEGWEDPVRSYLRALKTGRNGSNRQYALRYVGSMVGDIHRTLMYGGVFCYPADQQLHPRGNLQLLYKVAPFGYIVSKAGGKCTDGNRPLLDVAPKRIHERTPCFMGSPDDMDEMMSFVPHEEEP